MPQQYRNLRRFCALSLFVLFSITSHAQFVFTDDNASDRISLHEIAQIANSGHRVIPVKELISSANSLKYQPIEHENLDLGFNTDNFYVTFSLTNKTDRPLEYYLETARPITDLVELYAIRSDGKYTKMVTGDKMDCSKRAYKHRKSIFRIDLKPGEFQRYVIHMHSDGEVINLPLVLRTSENLMEITSLEQFTFGLFYGILVIAAIIYLFFFFGLKERTFIYYALYVMFIGLLQFSLDGYFYQYITPGGGWLSCHSVLLFATIAAFFLGRYSQLFLELKKYDRFMNRLLDILYGLLAISFLILVFVPSALPMCYPMANILGMLVLSLIVSSVIRLYKGKIPVDGFFTAGIFFLIAGFVIFILNNFGQIPTTFISQNSSKFGTGLEVIFLSLSMANLIRKVKNEREEFNRLALQRSEEMNDMKSYFLSNISHELRTPLNAILSLSTEMSKSSGDEKVKHDSQVIKYSAHSLLSSVNDILDFSKIEKGEIKLEPTQFEPVRMLEHIKNNAVIRAKDQELDFNYSKSDGIPDIFLGDAVRLAQIVNNVLSNAIKFTSEGSVGFHIGGKNCPIKNTA